MKRGRNKSGPGCNADLFDELEQELQAKLNGPIATRAKHGVECRVVRSSATASERAYHGRIGECRLAIAAGGAVRIGKVGVIEDVEHFHAELRSKAFGEMEILADGEVHIVEAQIAENVASHGSKLPHAIGQQYGLTILADIAAAGAVVDGNVEGRLQRAGGVRLAKRPIGSGLRVGEIHGVAGWTGDVRAATRSAICAQDLGVRPSGLEISRAAEQIPTVGQLAGSAEIVALIVDVPGLACLQGDNRIELPSF